MNDKNKIYLNSEFLRAPPTTPFIFTVRQRVVSTHEYFAKIMLGVGQCVITVASDSNDFFE
jgi:hypothetical protein